MPQYRPDDKGSMLSSWAQLASFMIIENFIYAGVKRSEREAHAK
jgi:hypothetical protein